MEYIVVRSWTKEGLVNDVNEVLKGGYSCQGGVAIDQDGYLYQAMVKTGIYVKD